LEWIRQEEDREMDRPSRTDWYLMQIAMEVCRGRVKEPRRVRLKDMLLKFTRPEDKPPMTREQATEMAKARWFGMLKVKGEQGK
jgi:hypothetical protein